LISAHHCLFRHEAATAGEAWWVWWDIPQVISDAIEDTHKNGCTQAVYTYDWGYQRPNNFSDPITNATSTISRYEFDFGTMMQRNLDSDSTREVRLVYIAK